MTKFQCGFFLQKLRKIRSECIKSSFSLSCDCYTKACPISNFVVTFYLPSSIHLRSMFDMEFIIFSVSVKIAGRRVKRGSNAYKRRKRKGVLKNLLLVLFQ